MPDLAFYADPDLYGPKDLRPAREGDAGIDLRSAATIRMSLTPRTRFVDLGVQVAIPEEHTGLLAIRSSAASKMGLRLANGIGIIDAGYRGPVRALIDIPAQVEIQRGDRICQLLVSPIPKLSITRVTDPAALGETERGTGGFGSTGKN
ncbi:dUTP diphosphatase [Corynebacterium sp. TAE3-ERU16]|uniref:dUTP diphosphatase n=1 Tax=Corynebacterium sp. TAE3-ERU16 TaxID=2849493 RepID=UPI001C46D511|nr:dUTP diphosphatase [Corynebacterium sp. TAE3-ERU16]MBV7292358.1 dUTP diphosphatase [Corynebacterium sp. TAE3-ERU16]